MKQCLYLFVLLLASCVYYDSADLRNAQLNYERAGDQLSVQKLEENQVRAKIDYIASGEDSVNTMLLEQELSKEMRQTRELRSNEAEAREELNNVRKRCCTDSQEERDDLFDERMDSIYRPDQYY